MKTLKYKNNLYRKSDDSKRKQALQDMQEALAGIRYLAESSNTSIGAHIGTIKTKLWVLGASDAPLSLEIKSLETKLAELSKLLKDLEAKSGDYEIRFTRKFKSELS
jgi:LysM repeat protein